MGGYDETSGDASSADLESLRRSAENAAAARSQGRAANHHVGTDQQVTVERIPAERLETDDLQRLSSSPHPSGGMNTMRHLTTPFFYGALLLGLTAGLHQLEREPAPAPPAVTFAQSADTVEAYDFVEVTVTVAKPTAKNPFTDVAVTGAFRRGDAAPVAVQGF